MTNTYHHAIFEHAFNGAEARRAQRDPADLAALPRRLARMRVRFILGRLGR